MSVFCKPCEKQINAKVDALILSSAFFIGGLRTDKDFRLKKNHSMLRNEIKAIVEHDIDKKFRPMSKAEHQYVNSLKSALKKRLSEIPVSDVPESKLAAANTKNQEAIKKNTKFGKLLLAATQDGFTFTMFKDQAAMKKNTKFGKLLIAASGIAGGVAFVPIVGPFLAAGIIGIPLVAKLAAVGYKSGQIGMKQGREVFRNILDRGLQVLGMRRISTAKHSSRTLMEVLNQKEITFGLGSGIGEKRVLKEASKAYEHATKEEKNELKKIYNNASNKVHDLEIGI